MSQQQLLPLLESLVACGLWEQLTDVATRMKRELEQEKCDCKQKLEGIYLVTVVVLLIT